MLVRTPLEMCSSEDYMSPVAGAWARMTVFVTKEFARFRRKARLSVEKLLDAASEVADGRFDADLGGGVFKQRVARDGGGKSGGFRTIIVFPRVRTASSSMALPRMPRRMCRRRS